MKAKFTIFIMFLPLFGCEPIKNDVQTPKKDESKLEFYYDEDRGVYALEKFDIDGIQIDTAFLFKDSLKKQLLELYTIIRKDNYPTINQIINYKVDGSIDTSESYFYDLNFQTYDYFQIRVGSQFNDSIYLEIGELDAFYENKGKVDSFNIENGFIEIKLKPFYKRARLGVWEKQDSGKFVGKELYIPTKYLIKK